MTTEACCKCGRVPEFNGREVVETHYIGCAALRPPGTVMTMSTVDFCAREGCMEPRAASRGPRPAKYCETHKTGKKEK